MMPVPIDDLIAAQLDEVHRLIPQAVERLDHLRHPHYLRTKHLQAIDNNRQCLERTVDDITSLDYPIQHYSGWTLATKIRRDDTEARFFVSWQYDLLIRWTMEGTVIGSLLPPEAAGMAFVFVESAHLKQLISELTLLGI